MAIRPITHGVRKALGLEEIGIEVNNKYYEYLLRRNEALEEIEIKFKNGSTIRTNNPRDTIHAGTIQGTRINIAANIPPYEINWAEIIDGRTDAIRDRINQEGGR